MALSELAALDAAYQTLQPLDPDGRRRALQWLADALAVEAPLTTLPTDTADSADTAVAASTDTATATESSREATTQAPAARRTPAAATRQPRRRTEPAAQETATPAPAAKRTRGTRTTRTTTGAARRARAGAQPTARAYRRMPPADEVMAAYHRIGSLAGLAEHFGVPGHTVQSWARQLRRHGYTIGQTR
jgi:hypothetical protein